MQIEQHGGNELIISGNIKSIEDSLQIKDSISTLRKEGGEGIVLRIRDSFSMTSTVIGFLMKLVNIDQVRISLVLGDRRLYELMEELSLVQPFNIRLEEK